jgi:hypothetical protein
MAEDKILLVARYVEGDMDEVENADFEARLLNDNELQQHFKDYQNIHQTLKMKLADREAFEDTLKGLNTKYFAEAPKVFSFKPSIRWLSGIAAILVIALFIWAPWNANLYESYADDSNMLVTERGAEVATDLDKAASFYNQENYTEANLIFQELYAKQQSNAMIGYYYGLSLIRTNKADKGREILIPLYNGESVYKYDSAYAIALSYLKENNKADCKAWLQKIPVKTTRYKQAKELLAKL